MCNVLKTGYRPTAATVTSFCTLVENEKTVLQFTGATKVSKSLDNKTYTNSIIDLWKASVQFVYLSLE